MSDAARLVTPDFDAHRARIEDYFDRTARDTWAALTSDAPVGRIRETVRAGRDEMRATLLSWLPENLAGATLLDAGCGTGALAVEAARRGAGVTAVDVAGGLIEVARDRAPEFFGSGGVDWHAGDMTDPVFGDFDHAVAMDSLIHYPFDDAVAAVAALAARTRRSLLFTFAPASPLLRAMHGVGKLFPRGNRSPMIVPVDERRLRRALAEIPGWTVARDRRVASGFYTSHAIAMVRVA
jgi:magnesium-protoporphyrin O-methyltransferase